MSRKMINRTWANTAMVSCFLACLCDLFSVPVFARFYPGYDPISQPISILGASGSPIARFVSWCWIFIGILFLLFAVGYGLSNPRKLTSHKIAAWLIAIYGLGEEIGSGVFPGNHLAGSLTVTGWTHNILGGAGMAALMILPPVLMKKFTKSGYPIFYRFCQIITVLGLVIFLGFTISHIASFTGHRFALKHGLWQRLWVINYYVFLMAIAGQLVIEDRKKESLMNPLPQPEPNPPISRQ
jgi:hypothetical protein